MLIVQSRITHENIIVAHQEESNSHLKDVREIYFCAISCFDFWSWFIVAFWNGEMGKSADGLWHAQKVITEFDFGWINLNTN